MAKPQGNVPSTGHSFISISFIPFYGVDSRLRRGDLSDYLLHGNSELQG